MSKSLSQLYPEKEIAESLGISQTGLAELRRSRGVPHYRICGHVYYHDEELMGWIQNHLRVNGEDPLEEESPVE